MAKSASPIRLEAGLMEAATTAGQIFHRSTAEQIEYWAAIGRSVTNLLDPCTLASVTSGLVKLRVEPVIIDPIDPDTVFASLERDRESGVLTQQVSTSAVRYQAAKDHTGLLEQVGLDGSIRIGRFENGTFIPVGK